MCFQGIESNQQDRNTIYGSNAKSNRCWNGQYSKSRWTSGNSARIREKDQQDKQSLGFSRNILPEKIKMSSY